MEEEKEDVKQIKDEVEMMTIRLAVIIDIICTCKQILLDFISISLSKQTAIFLVANSSIVMY